MDGLVQELKEQISTLSAYLDEERRKRRKVEEKLRLKHQERMEALSDEHKAQMHDLERQHEEYISLLKRHHKSILGVVESTYQDGIKRLRNEYALLQAALRNYKDVVRSDIGKAWAEKEECIRLESERKASEMITTVRHEMERQFRIEKDELIKEYEEDAYKRMRKAGKAESAESGTIAETLSESVSSGQTSLSNVSGHVTELDQVMSDSSSKKVESNLQSGVFTDSRDAQSATGIFIDEEDIETLRHIKTTRRSNSDMLVSKRLSDHKSD